MPIKVVDLTVAEFQDVSGVQRSFMGCPLSKRGELGDALKEAWRIFEDNPDCKIDEIDKAAPLIKTSELCGLEWGWLHSEQGSLVHEFLFVYEKDGQLYQGDLEAIEFGYKHASPQPPEPLDIQPRFNQTEFFDELWFKDCHDQLTKVVEPDIYQVHRFRDLLQILPLTSIGESWDTDDIAREIITEILGLFELSPNSISAPMANSLILSVDTAPGYLFQLIATAPSEDAEPLPDGETVRDATIAALMNERVPLNVVMDSVRGVSQKQLESILRSRKRMVDAAMEQAKSKSGPKVKPKDRKKLMDAMQRALGAMGNGGPPKGQHDLPGVTP